MGRNYTERDPRDGAGRAGDTRWNDPESRGEMSDGTDWQPMGGDSLHYKATTKAGLIDPTTILIESVGRVDGSGADNGMFCVPSPDGTTWDALNFWE